MNSCARIVVGVLVLCACKSAFSQPPAVNDVVSQAGGISEASPTVSSSQLDYRVCNSSNSDQQALLKINIIGNGANQVPLGSTITSATLRLKAQVGGDGLLYRCAIPWVNLPIWNDVDGLANTIGPFVGIAMNTNQSVEWPVTSHVQEWANGTPNQGWLIKGSVDDCSAARIYNGTAGVNDRPRLTVIFVPPDTTAPQVMDIDVGSSVSTHADYDVPDGSGEQIRTIPVAKADQILVTFSENVTNVSGTTVFLETKAGVAIPASVGYASNVAALQLTTPITAPTQVVLTVASGSSGVRDAANNQLDGEWTNPASLSSTGTDTFPSGNGSAGGAFAINFTVLPGDFNRNNAIDAADYTVWRNHLGITSGAGQADGDADGDGDVDNDDYLIWKAEFGINFTTW